MDRIAQGAEAILTKDGGTLIKERVAKGYRHEQLDERLRAERTEQEARLLAKARQAGVRVPAVQEQEGVVLRLAWVDGTPVKDVLADRLDLCGQIGDSIARLHNADIVHGDLTTSNMLVNDGEVVFIDFGLGFFSQRAEDYATDLHLFREVLESTHTAVADEAMANVLQAYRDQFRGDVDAVMDRYQQIAGRGRYQ